MTRSYSKKYRQLKLQVDPLYDQYHGVLLSFHVRQHKIEGVLNGSISDWTFQSNNAVFLHYIPTGKLNKYMLWEEKIPACISNIYNGILEAAFKTGYDLFEKEEHA